MSRFMDFSLISSPTFVNTANFISGRTLIRFKGVILLRLDTNADLKFLITGDNTLPTSPSLQVFLPISQIPVKSPLPKYYLAMGLEIQQPGRQQSTMTPSTSFMLKLNPTEQATSSFETMNTRSAQTN